MGKTKKKSFKPKKRYTSPKLTRMTMAFKTPVGVVPPPPPPITGT